jgi:hypothetical protein
VEGRARSRSGPGSSAHVGRRGGGSQRLRWTNLGKSSETVLLGPEAVAFNSDDVLTAVVLHSVGSPSTSVAARPTPQGPAHLPASNRRILDLGTANGDLLLHAHSAHGVPFSHLMGISAVDERSDSVTLSAGTTAGQARPGPADSTGTACPPAVPDTSYRTGLNIDTLGELLESEPDAVLPAHFVWSSCTYYHLADPIAAVQQAYSLLAVPAASSDPPSTAILTHVPLSACCADGLDLDALNQYWADNGVAAAAAPMSLNPDCYVVVLLRLPHQTGPLPMPFVYTGSVRRTVEGFAGCYIYATVRWSEAEPAAGGAMRRGVAEPPPEPLGQCGVAGLLDRHLSIRLKASSCAPPASRARKGHAKGCTLQ